MSDYMYDNFYNLLKAQHQFLMSYPTGLIFKENNRFHQMVLTSTMGRTDLGELYDTVVMHSEAGTLVSFIYCNILIPTRTLKRIIKKIEAFTEPRDRHKMMEKYLHDYIDPRLGQFSHSPPGD